VLQARPSAAVVAGLAGAVAAAGVAPRAPRVVLYEQHPAAGGVAAAEVGALRTRHEVDRAAGDHGRDHVERRGAEMVHGGAGLAFGGPLQPPRARRALGVVVDG